MVETYSRLRDKKMKEFRAAIAEQFTKVYGRKPTSNMETLGSQHEKIMQPVYEQFEIFPTASKVNAYSTIADATGHLFNLWNAVHRP